MSKTVNLKSATSADQVNDTLQLTPASVDKPVQTTDIKTKTTRNKSKQDNLNKIRQTTFQARLGRRLDHIGRRLTDNSIRLTGHTTDMLRVEVKRDERTHDPISNKLTKAEVIPIILPPMKDIPLRQLTREGTEVKVPSLYVIDQNTYWEAYAPAACDLNIDDLLIRILWTDDDETCEVDEPYIFVTQVKEILGTFGASSLKWKKVWLTLADDSARLPQEIINWIKNSVTKRENISF